MTDTKHLQKVIAQKHQVLREKLKAAADTVAAADTIHRDAHKRYRMAERELLELEAKAHEMGVSLAPAQ